MNTEQGGAGVEVLPGRDLVVERVAGEWVVAPIVIVAVSVVRDAKLDVPLSDDAVTRPSREDFLASFASRLMELPSPHANGGSVLSKLDDFFIELAVIPFALEAFGASSEATRAAVDEDGGKHRMPGAEFGSRVVARHAGDASLGPWLLNGGFGGSELDENVSKLEDAVPKLGENGGKLGENGGKLGENEGTLAFIVVTRGDALPKPEENGGKLGEKRLATRAHLRRRDDQGTIFCTASRWVGWPVTYVAKTVVAEAGSLVENHAELVSAT